MLKEKRCVLGNGAPLPSLEGELLGLILRHMTRAEDIIRCSAVSRIWAEASRHTQHTSLVLYHSTVDGSETQIAQAQLRWLQDLQKNERLRTLQQIGLYVHDGHDEDPGPTPSFLSQGLLVLAGSWPLTKIELCGPVCFHTAVAMLPASLLALELWLDAGPKVTRLSSFQRFPKLQVLRLAIGSQDTASGLPEYDFVVDCSFPDLVFLVLHDRLFLRACPPGSKLGELVPKLEHASFQIKADDAGVKLAEDAIRLGHLKKLELDLTHGDGHEVDLLVPNTSHLQELLVSGPDKSPRVVLTLGKAGVKYICECVYKICNTHQLPHMYSADYLTVSM